MMVVGEETVLKTVRPETELRGNDSRGRGGIKEFWNDWTKWTVLHCLVLPLESKSLYYSIQDVYS